MRVDQFSDEPLGHQSAIWEQKEEAVAFIYEYRRIFIATCVGLSQWKKPISLILRNQS